MEKEFILYEQALALKELGFEEKCAVCFLFNGNKLERELKNLSSKNEYPHIVSAPLYQQAFRWLYQKLDIEKGVMPLDTESQQLLLKELIDKVSSKHLLV